MKKSLVIAAILTAVVTAIWHLPAAWIAGPLIPKNLTPRPQFIGTVWNGQIPNIDGINPVHFTVKPLNMLRGKPPATFESVSPYLQFTGTATLAGSISTQAKGYIRGLGVFDTRFRTLAGQYDLTLSNMRIRNTCQSGEGQFSTNLLAENRAVWEWTGPILSGPIRCENGQIIAQLKGADTQQNIEAVLRIDLSGAYRVDVDVNTRDSRAEFVLPLYGFEKTEQGYSLLEEGRWQ